MTHARGTQRTGLSTKTDEASTPRVALLGNPNTGKTTTFNALTGLRHKTSNFPGTTVEARIGATVLKRGDGQPAIAAEIIDLPGIYSLELDQLESAICRDMLAGRITPAGDALAEPDAICLVLDATNLARNLPLLGEALRRRLPTVVAVNMIDLARRAGTSVDAAALSRAVGCPVVCISAKSGEAMSTLRTVIADTVTTGVVPTFTPPGDEQGLRRWADQTFVRCVSRAADSGNGAGKAGARRAMADPLADNATDKLDRVLTHPVAGMAIFALVMAALFVSIFSIAKLPMDLIDTVFTSLSSLVAGALPAGLLSDLLVNGVIAGVGATVIFIPQICLLFFLIGLLEDTGYLARGAFVMDRILRPFGLPGHSFVPLLSSHACALPGIMSTRCIPDPKERLATILVAPFMTCSARLPVYVLLAGVLFPGQPVMAALAFIACYALGIAAGILSALIARRTILRGKARPMALELPSYKVPSLRTAIINTYDRGLIFLKKAGTIIMCICILLWWLGAFPRVAAPEAAIKLREQAAAMQAAAPAISPSDSAPSPSAVPQPVEAQVADLLAQADRVEHRHAKANSMLGIIGRTAQPALSPLGVDWQLSVGILASFAAREVFVGTMSVVIAGSEESDDDAENVKIRDTLASALRDDGKTLVFNRPTSWALLVFYVLAMQCLPTLAVTAREAGHIKWAILQLVWMSGMAFIFAAVVYQVAIAFGGAA